MLFSINGKLRPNVDWNNQGQFANLSGGFNIAFAGPNPLLYANDSSSSVFDFKRDGVSPVGLQWLSSTSGLITGYGTEIRYAQGLLYASTGIVVDPEASRRVGQFVNLGDFAGTQPHVWPDPAAGQVYFALGWGWANVLAFDIKTYASQGSLQWKLSGDCFLLSLVKFGDDGLAFHTGCGQVFTVKASSIPKPASAQ